MCCGDDKGLNLLSPSFWHQGLVSRETIFPKLGRCERCGVAVNTDGASLAHKLLTSCCAAHCLLGHAQTQVHAWRLGTAGLNKAAYDKTSTQEVKVPRREPFASHSAGAAHSLLLGQSFSDTFDLPCLALSTLRCQTPVQEAFRPAPRLLTILNTFRAPHSGPDTFQTLSTCYLA